MIFFFQQKFILKKTFSTRKMKKIKRLFLLIIFKRKEYCYKKHTEQVTGKWIFPCRFITISHSQKKKWFLRGASQKRLFFERHLSKNFFFEEFHETVWRGLWKSSWKACAWDLEYHGAALVASSIMVCACLLLLHQIFLFLLLLLPFQLHQYQ